MTIEGSGSIDFDEIKKKQQRPFNVGEAAIGTIYLTFFSVRVSRSAEYEEEKKPTS